MSHPPNCSCSDDSVGNANGVFLCCCILAKTDVFEEALLKLWHCLCCLNHVLNCFCKHADGGFAFLSPASVEAGVAIVVNEVAVE